VAAASEDPVYAGRGGYNLGSLLASHGRLGDAVEALRSVPGDAEPEVAASVRDLLDALARIPRVERLVPLFDDRHWRLSRAALTDVTILEEYRPVDVAEAEKLSVDSLGLAKEAPMEDPDTVRAIVEARAIDGRVEWELLQQDEQEQLHSWSMTDDVVAGDRFGLVRVVRGARALHLLSYENHASDETLATREQWLARLCAARLTQLAPPAALSAPPVPEEVREAADALNTTPTAHDSPTLVDRARHALSLLEAGADDRLRIELEFGLACHLEEGVLDRDGAIAAFRRVLEIVTLEQLPDVWALTMFRLGKLFAARDTGDRNRNAGHAAAAYRQALRVFEHGSANWADAMIALADVQPPSEATVELYQQVIDALLADFTLGGADQKRSLTIYVRAAEGIQIAGRQLMGGEVVVPDGFDERTTLGSLIFLRPLITSGRLVVRNRFQRPTALTVRYAREPEEVTLEGALNRILAEHFSVVSIGGRPESYGPSRLLTGDDDWKRVFDFVLEDCVLVMLVPHVSDGVRWEVEQLIARNLLHKTIFVMPPLTEHLDVATMWEEGRALLGELELRLPRYDGEGMFVHLDADGQVSSSWPFDVVWSDTLLPRLTPLLPPR